MTDRADPQIGALISRKVPPTKTEKVSVVVPLKANDPGDAAETSRDARRE
jgi:hypothetical protein